MARSKREAFDSDLSAVADSDAAFADILKNNPNKDERYAEVARYTMGNLRKLPPSLLPYFNTLFTGQPGATRPGGSSNPGAPSRSTRLNVPYANLIAAAANKYGIPQENLAAIIKAESGFKAGERNKASGATGLGQVMPSDTHITRHGVNYDKLFASRPTTKQLLDPATNIEWTAKILAGNWKRTGSWEGAASRYFGIGTDAQGTTTAQAMRNYNRALAQITGGRATQGRELTRPNPAVSAAASPSRLVASGVSAVPRIATAIASIAALSSQQVSLLSRIAASVGKPIVVTVQGAPMPSGVSKTSQTSGASSITGANAGGWRK